MTDARSYTFVWKFHGINSTYVSHCMPLQSNLLAANVLHIFCGPKTILLAGNIMLTTLRRQSRHMSVPFC